jgi:hypothetical protein
MMMRDGLDFCLDWVVKLKMGAQGFQRKSGMSRDVIKGGYQ